jgi:hypothetical protein
MRPDPHAPQPGGQRAHHQQRDHQRQQPFSTTSSPATSADYTGRLQKRLEFRFLRQTFTRRRRGHLYVEHTERPQGLNHAGGTVTSYNVHAIDIGKDQFSGFVAISPNSKIPAIVDSDGLKRSLRVVRIRRNPLVIGGQVRAFPVAKT